MNKEQSNALSSSKHKYTLNINGNIVTPIKRNLLFTAALSISAMFVSPSNGKYEIHLLVVSGKVNHPELIFIGLLIVCAYHLYHLWINIKQPVFDATNYPKMEEVFMFELASEHAASDWHSLKEQNTPKANIGVRFSKSPKEPREMNKWKVRAEIETQRLTPFQEFLKAIKEHPRFSILDMGAFTGIEYMYEATPDDYLYLTMHKDQFWLTKKKEFVEYVMPLVLGLIAILALLYKIWILA